MKGTNFLGLYNRLNSWSDFLSLADRLPNPDTILKSKNETVALFRGLLGGSQISAAIQAREMALKSFEYEFRVDSTNKNDLYALDHVKDNFLHNDKIDIEMLIQEMLEAVWLGYSPIETITMNDGKHIYYEELIGRSAEHFAFDVNNNLIFLSKKNPVKGELVPTSGPDKTVELVAYRATHRNPYGMAQLSPCFWPAHFIKGDMKLWLAYIDRVGNTPILIRTSSTDNKYRRQLQTVIEDIRSSGGGVLGTLDSLDFLNADKVASSTLFKEFNIVNNAAISKVILGHSSALDATPGKLGNDQNALVVRGDIVEADKKFIAAAMNRLIRWIVDQNIDVDVYPRYKNKQEEDVQSDRANRDVTLTSIGVKFQKNYVSRTYNLQDDDFEMTDIQAPAPMFQENNDPLKKKASAELAEEDGSNDRPVDLIIESALKRVQRDYKGLIDAVSIAIKNAETWNQALADVIRADNRTKVNSDYTERTLLTTQVLGMAEAYDEMPAKTKAVLFAEDTASEIKGVMKYPEARKFLTGKLAMSDKEYSKLSAFTKEYAFAITGISKDEISHEILGKMVTAQTQGFGYDTFAKSVSPDILAKNSLRLAFRQNMNTSYMAGRYDEMKSAAEYLPYWEYYTVGDNRVRDSHAALDGTIRRYDDPFWNVWYPPNGFNCRCGVRALPQEKIDKMKAKPGTGIPDYAELAKEGKITDVNISGEHKATDKFLPDEGFRHNPAKVRTEWLEFKVNQNSNLPTSGTRTILNNLNWQTAGLKEFKKMGYNTTIKLTPQTKESLTEYLNKTLPKLKTVSFVKDKTGKNIYVDINHFIRHIGKQKSRFNLAAQIRLILSEPDEVWVNIQYKGNATVIVRNYLKRINNKNVLVVAHGKQGVFTLRTIINKVNIDNERVGVLLK